MSKSRQHPTLYAKGTSGNPAGRPRGTKNVKTMQWEALGESITTAHAAQFDALMNELWESKDVNERLRAAELYLKVLGYFKPQLRRVDAVAAPKDMPQISIVVQADEAEIEAEVSRRLEERLKRGLPANNR